MAIDRLNSLVKSLLICSFALLFACSQSSTQRSNLLMTNPGTPPSQSPADKDQSNVVKISAVGDIMLGGTSEPVFQEHGYDYAFAQVKHLFANSDVVIGNLEGPLTHSDTPYDVDKKFLFKTPPELVAPALKNAGFNLMNLANNHIMDFGEQGMRDTIEALHQHGIQSVGVGSNLEEARRGTSMTVGKYKIGFLSYSLTFPKSFWAQEDRAGSAFGHEHQIRSDVRRMKQSNDLVIVSYHWGKEKAPYLRDYQPTLAHAAIDEGAALVIGHHPHVLQAVESYKQGIILYSLGNFAFGSYSQVAESSVVANLSFKNGKFDSLELIPINVLNVDVIFQPYVLEGLDADAVIDHLNELSLQQNTHLNNNDGIAFLNNTSRMSESLSKLH